MTVPDHEPKRNRGKNSGDDRLFASIAIQQRFREAISDMHFLLSRGYAERSSLALVGNRHRLNVRQQQALRGMSASATQIAERKKRSLSFAELKGKELVIDGFNILIALESYLSGAYIFKGLDGFYRDLSSVHGSYKRVKQTAEAIQLIAGFYEASGATAIHWYFDKPVSNSGKLKQLLEELARECHYHWEISLVFNPDREIAGSNQIALTSDAWILDNAPYNFNLMAYILSKGPSHNVLTLNE